MIYSLGFSFHIATHFHRRGRHIPRRSRFETRRSQIPIGSPKRKATHLMCVCHFIFGHGNGDNGSKLELSENSADLLAKRAPTRAPHPLAHPSYQHTLLHPRHEFDSAYPLDCDGQMLQTWFSVQFLNNECVFGFQIEARVAVIRPIARERPFLSSQVMSARAFAGVPRQFAKAMRFQR